MLLIFPFLMFSISMFLLFLVNSIAGLPPAITNPMCPNQIEGSGYVDIIEFVQTDCVTAVKDSEQQVVPYFKGIDIGFIIFTLLLTVVFVRLLSGGESRSPVSSRRSGMLDSSIWEDSSDSLFSATQTAAPAPQSQQQVNDVQQPADSGFHNPFDF